MIDAATLIACGIAPTQAKAFAQHLAAAFDRFGIAAARQQAALIAQAMHESRNFTAMKEGLFYRDPARIMAVWPRRFPTLATAAPFARNPQALANKVYALRMGNTEPGDGWRFRGRGLFQITGRTNYTRAGAALEMSLATSPELVAEPPTAALTAAWYWQDSGCAQALGRGFAATTQIINGGQIGAADRLRHFEECCEALGV